MSLKFDSSGNMAVKKMQNQACGNSMSDHGLSTDEGITTPMMKFMIMAKLR